VVLSDRRDGGGQFLTGKLNWEIGQKVKARSGTTVDVVGKEQMTSWLAPKTNGGGKKKKKEKDRVRERWDRRPIKTFLPEGGKVCKRKSLL